VWTGWTGIKTGWTGFCRLCVRAVCQPRSLHRQFRRLCCQCGRFSAQSTSFSTRFTVHAAVKPVEPVSEPVLVRLTSRRLLLFLLPFLISLFTLSFVTADVAFTFPLSLSLSHSHHTPNPFRAVKSLRSLLETCSSRPPPSTPSSSLGFLWLNHQIEVLPYFLIFLTRSNTVRDCLVYLFKDTV
jgi:hypothetical protein